MASNKNETTVVDEFCLITGANVDRAKYILEACNYDLQMAVNLQLENLDAGSPPAAACEEVRPPILPREDVLVDSLETHVMNRSAHANKRTSVFDSFRDFQVETNQQEEMLGSSNRTNRTNHRSKIRRLEDLFRPPLDIIFHGSFQMARDSGIHKNKWLMVNPQNSAEFPCQVLNRDIWSDAAIKSIVAEHFIFWQVYVDSTEGQQYNQYYHIDRYPYVSIIDPRTGELMKKWHVIEKPFFAEQLLHFLTDHPLPANQQQLASREEKQKQKKLNVSQTVTSESAMIPHDNMVAAESTSNCTQSRSQSGQECINGEDSSLSLTEDSSSNSNDSVTLPPSQLDEASTQECSHSTLSLCLRFPNSHREIVKFPGDSKLEALQTLLTSRGYPSDKFQYMTYFPKRVLNSSSVSSMTFTSLGIVHNETIFIHVMDNHV